MDSHLFRVMGLELAKFLHGARVEKISSPMQDIFSFHLFNQGAKSILIWCSNRQNPYFYLTKSKLPSPPKPSGLVMLLRKYVQSRRLGAPILNWLNRRIVCAVAQGINQEAAWLVLDLKAGPSLLKELPDDVRETLFLEPLWPDTKRLERDKNGLIDWDQLDLARTYPVLSPKLRKNLASLTKSVDEAEAEALLNDLAMDSKSASGAFYYYCEPETPNKVELLSAWPLTSNETKGLTENYSAICSAPHSSPKDSITFLEPLCLAFEPAALLSLGLQADKGGKIQQNREKKRLSKLLLKLQDEEKRLIKMQKLRESAIMIQASLWQFHPTDKYAAILIYQKQTGFSVQGISEAELAKHTTNTDEICIELDPIFTVRENMSKLFKEADRGDRGLVHLAKRKIEVAKLLESASIESSLLQKNLSPPTSKISGKQSKQSRLTEKAGKLVQKFISSDGFILLRGKSAEGNHALLRLAQSHDVWMHVKDGPSAHVLIKRAGLAQEIPRSTLIEAGILSAVKSWKKLDNKAEIISALAKDVRPVKGGAAGSVLVATLLESFIVNIDRELEGSLASSPNAN